MLALAQLVLARSDDQHTLQPLPTAEHHISSQGRTARNLSGSTAERLSRDFAALRRKFSHGDYAGVNATFWAPHLDVRLALGVATASDWVDERNVHRSTWFQDSFVCRAALWRECTIKPVFLLDYDDDRPLTPALLAENRSHADMVFIHGTLSQKVRRWFSVALAAFPGVNFVGKCDIDTYVNPLLLSADLVCSGLWQDDEFEPRRLPGLWQDHGCELRRLPSTYAVYGHFITGDRCSWMEHEPPRRLSEPIDENVFCYCPPAHCTSKGYTDECWSYAQGGLYVLTVPLINELRPALESMVEHARTLPESNERRAYSCEDAVLGKALQRLAHSLRADGETVNATEGAGISAVLNERAINNASHAPWAHLFYGYEMSEWYVNVGLGYPYYPPPKEAMRQPSVKSLGRATGNRSSASAAAASTAAAARNAHGVE